MNLQIIGKKLAQTQIYSVGKIQTKPKQSKLNNKLKRNILSSTKPKQEQPKKINLINKKEYKKNQIQKIEQETLKKVQVQTKNDEKLNRLKQEQNIQNENVNEIRKIEKSTEQLIQMNEKLIVGSVTVRYNHYKEQFKTINNVLSFAPIDERYNFFDVFLGNYILVLKVYRKTEQIVALSKGTAKEYSWHIDPSIVYEVQICEDEEAENQREKKIYKAPLKKDTCLKKQNARVQAINAQLIAMDPALYGSQLHRRLLQERDLEDILYS